MGVRLERIGHCDHPGGAAVQSNEYRRLAVASQALGDFFKLAQRDVGSSHEGVVADPHRRRADHRRHPLPRQGFGVACGFELQGVGPRRSDDGLGNRMLRGLLRRGRQTQHLGFGEAVMGGDVGDARLALREGAGLVENDGLELVGGFQSRTASEQDAQLGALAGADPNRRRGGESQRARAGDNQHGHEVEERKGNRRGRAPQEPGRKRQQGNAKHRGHEDGGHFVGQPLDGRLGALRLFDQPDDLRQHRVASNPRGAHGKAAGLVERGAEDGITGGSVHRQTLAGEHRLVERRVALGDLTVHRHLFARPHQHQIAKGHVPHRDVHGLAVAPHAGRPGLQAHEFADGLGRLAARSCFDQAAQDDQGKDHDRGIEVDVRADTKTAEHSWQKRDRGAVQVGGGSAEGDEGAHVGAFLLQAPPRRPGRTASRPRTAPAWRGRGGRRVAATTRASRETAPAWSPA